MKYPRTPFSTRSAAALLTAGIIAAAGWPAAAHAEPATDDSITDALTKFGQSLCPKLVEPGASLATSVSELQGNSGLTPQITGMVTGLAIQLQCPALMASIASGDLPKLLRERADKGSPATPFTPALPFPLPGGMH